MSNQTQYGNPMNQTGFSQAGTSQYDFNNVKQIPPPSSYGKQLQSRGQVGTAAKGRQESRPLTSNRAVNFSSKNFDPMNQGSKIPAPVELTRKDLTPEEQMKVQEKEISNMVDTSAQLALRGQLQDALEKAKEAAAREKTLRRQKETQNLIEQINGDLSYYVGVNLAIQFQANGLYQEALQKYNEIIKSRQFPQAGRLRVNIGNIFFSQKKYPTAIKMYRMALDIIPGTSKEMRFKILKNIGHAFVKLGQFHDAINSYESIMKTGADFQTGFNLILCLYAANDKTKMKDCLISMLNIEIPGMQEEDDEEINKETTATDKLREEFKEKKKEACKYIIEAIKLIAPSIEEDITVGYDWAIELLKNSNFPEVESEIEICKAMSYLKKKNIEKAIETLKGFEKKDKIMMARAASNISFLYFLEADYKNGEKYAEIAINYDRYNAKALVNRGNCLFVKNEFLRAKEQYLEAIGVEADCIEALYNLAFVNKKLNMHIEALQALEKLQTIVSSCPEVIYQIASIYEMMGNMKQALKWYQILLTKTPSDPTILARVGNLFARDEDESQALHYFLESYKYMPVNLDTISWLGIYYVKHDLYERACHFFDRASQIQPREVKWKLMVASCTRRMGNYQKALKLYEDIHQENPENLECLRFLVQLCKEMNLPYDNYAGMLKKIERAQENTFGGFNNNEEQEVNEAPPQMAKEKSVKQRNNQEDENISVNIQKAAPKKAEKQKQENDDWAKDDLDDEMLPT